VSYASISTRNEIGVKRIPGLSGQLRFLSGLGSLRGTVSQTDLTDAGVDPGVATTLLALGATDAQLNAVIQNPDSQTASLDLLTQLSGNGPAPGQAAGTAANFPTPSGLQAQSVSQTGYDLTDPASWYDVTGQFQQANQRIKALEQLVISNPSVYAPLIGNDTIALRQQYTDAASKWTAVYVTAIGQQPQGLSGVGVKGRIARLGALGVAPIIIGAAVIAAAAIAIYALHTLIVYLQSTEAKAAQQTQQQGIQAATATQQSLLNQYNQTIQAAQSAAAAGNTTLAAQYTQAAGVLAAQLKSTGYNLTPSTGSALATWFTANWGWLAVAAVAIVALPPLIKKL